MRVKAYVGTIGLLAIFVFSFVYGARPDVSWGEIRAGVSFGILGAISLLLSYNKVGRQESGSIAFLPFITSVIVAPVWTTVVSAGAAMLVVEIMNRRMPIKALFNIGQNVLGVSLSIIVYQKLGGHSQLAGTLHPNLVAFCSTLLMFVAVNTAALNGVIAVSERKQFWPLWRAQAPVTLLYDVLALPFVYAFAWFYLQFGAPGALALVIPLLGVRELYKVNWELQQTNQELLQLMVAAIEARDPYTSGHSRRVSRNSRLIAQAIGLRDKQVERVAVAALLHDVGKIHEVFAPILSKPGRLTAEENAIMQTHPIKSEELVRMVSQLKDVVAPIRHHHENWDGTGYPDGLVGENIPIASRIIMFADTIDAMTTDRPYRAALTETQVRAEFVKLRGRQFDPGICDQLLASPIYRQLFDQDVPLTPVIAAGQDRWKTPAPAPLLAS
jgi:hypothetical protein